MIDKYCPSCGSRLWKNGYVFAKKEKKAIIRFKCKNYACQKKIQTNKMVERIRCESCNGNGYI
jgi:transposase-like protein